MIIKKYFFLFHIETICCDPLSEPSRRDDSDEKSLHMLFYEELTRVIPNYHQISHLI